MHPAFPQANYRLVLETWVSMKFPDGIRHVVFIKSFIQWSLPLLLVGTVVVGPLISFLRVISDLVSWSIGEMLNLQRTQTLFSQETHSYFLSLKLEENLETLCCSLNGSHPNWDPRKQRSTEWPRASKAVKYCPPLCVIWGRTSLPEEHLGNLMH